MNFWKTSFWSGVSTLAKLSSAFVVAKVVAVYSGPATLGIIGQFQSFSTIMQLGTGGIFRNGLVRYSSVYRDDKVKLTQFIETAIKFGFISSIIIGLLISVSSHFLSILIFHDASYWWLIVLYGLTLFSYTINQCFVSVFNGINQLGKYAFSAIASAILSILLISILTYYFRTNGALVGLILSQLFLVAISIPLAKRALLQFSLFSPKSDSQALKSLLTFSLMSVTSAIALPLAQICLRSYLAHSSSWGAVGYWQAILRISDAYLMIITTVIITYAMPKYSRIDSKKELFREVLGLAIKLLPLVILLAGVIFIFRTEIILILFSKKFLAMKPLFFYQLIGDVVRVCSLLLAYVLLAKAKVRLFVVFEIGFAVSYLLLSIIFFNTDGLVGLTKAFCINYIIYLVLLMIWFYRYLKQ